MNLYLKTKCMFVDYIGIEKYWIDFDGNFRDFFY